MSAILILGVILVPWLDDMRAVSSAIAQPLVSAEQERRRLQQQIPGGNTAKDWDELDAAADQWLGKQPDDRMMSFMELDAKRATGQITEEQWREGVDILLYPDRNAPPIKLKPAPRRRRP
jgi:hypothetical protein